MIAKNASYFFILPAAGIRSTDKEVLKQIDNTYLYDKPDSNQIPQSVFVKFVADADTHVIEPLKLSAAFVKEHEPKDGNRIFEFSIDKEHLSDVGIIMSGQYSKVSSTYVDTLFPQDSSLVIGTRAVFKKADYLRNYWEERIGTPLPDNAEVWSKVNPEKETLFLT